MKIRTYLSFVLASSFLVVSCKKELEPQESSEPETTAEVQAAETSATEGQTPMQQQMQQQMPQTTMPQTTMPNTSTQQAAPQTVAKGMNPAHGQPGHRCEIPVGAPLNSAPAASKAQGNKPQVISNDASTSITPAQVNANGSLTPANAGTPTILNPGASTAAGMNPAHGQPGHRCDIAVGQPLP